MALGSHRIWSGRSTRLVAFAFSFGYSGSIYIISSCLGYDLDSVGNQIRLLSDDPLYSSLFDHVPSYSD